MDRREVDKKVKRIPFEYVNHVYHSKKIKRHYPKGLNGVMFSGYFWNYIWVTDDATSTWQFNHETRRMDWMKA